jgi:hypothetical protein
MNKFDTLLRAMATNQPKPLGKPARGRPPSSAGAARFSMEKHGAQWGEGIGRVGNSYAIPTMMALHFGFNIITQHREGE